jgi:hypothetical protein
MKIIMSVLFAATLGCGGAQSSAPPTASAHRRRSRPLIRRTARPTRCGARTSKRGQDEYEKKKYQEAEDSFMAA